MTMDEFFATSRLSAYLDGELSDTEMSEVARAIAENPQVKRSYDEMKHSVEALRRYGPVDAPPHLHARVMQGVLGLPMPSRRLAWLRRPIGRFSLEGFAVAAVAVTVLVLVWQVPRSELKEPVGKEDPAASVEVPPAPDPTLASQERKAQDKAEPEQQEAQSPPLDFTNLELGSLKPKGAYLDSSGRGLGVGSRTGSAPAIPRNSPDPQANAASPAPYVPEWDQEPNASAPPSTIPVGDASATSLYVYRLYPSRPDALWRVLALVEQMGGRVTGADGKALQPFELTDADNFARLAVSIPADQLERLEPELRRLGGVSEIPGSAERILGPGQVRVDVDVMYKP